MPSKRFGHDRPIMSKLINRSLVETAFGAVSSVWWNVGNVDNVVNMKSITTNLHSNFIFLTDYCIYI